MSGSVDSDAFRTRLREREAQDFGVWLFLVAEGLIFGAFLLPYAILRWHYPEGFDHAGAETSIVLGTLNTAILLTSSLTMALAELRAGQGRAVARRLLVVTAVLGLAFMVLKAWEWYDHYEHGLVPFLGLDFTYDGPEPWAAVMFFRLYFAATGLHMLHLAVAVSLVGGAALLWPSIAAEKRGQRATAFALYWHLVDVVWVVLFPLFYLLGRAG